MGPDATNFPLNDRYCRGALIEIEFEDGHITWHRAKELAGYYIRIRGPIELDRGRYTITLFLDGIQALRVPLEVAYAAVLTTLWDDPPPSEPDLLPKGLRYYPHTLEDFERNEDAPL